MNLIIGIHVGWAIEGAIGSDKKIDASYLSPHVNMASRMEAATKQYGLLNFIIANSLIFFSLKSILVFFFLFVSFFFLLLFLSFSFFLHFNVFNIWLGVPLLITEPFVSLLSEKAKSLCRKLDVVTVKGRFNFCVQLCLFLVNFVIFLSFCCCFVSLINLISNWFNSIQPMAIYTYDCNLNANFEVNIEFLKVKKKNQ